jgi:hypothetical protein
MDWESIPDTASSPPPTCASAHTPIVTPVYTPVPPILLLQNFLLQNFLLQVILLQVILLQIFSAESESYWYTLDTSDTTPPPPARPPFVAPVKRRYDG